MDPSLQPQKLDFEVVPSFSHWRETLLHGAAVPISPTAPSLMPAMMNGSGVSAPPDRHNFETEIWRVNNEISNVHREMSAYWTEQRRQESEALKTDRLTYKQKFDAENANATELKNKLAEAQTKFNEKKSELTRLEDTDLGYKDSKVAKEKLAALETRFNNTSITNMRNENIFVNEMNRLKRNIVKLKTYEPLLAEFKQLEADCKELRSQLRVAKDAVWVSRDAYKKIKQREQKLHSPIRKMLITLKGLKGKKKALIEKYEHDRKLFTQWLIAHPAARGMSSFPNAMLSSDQEELEPFYKQKRSCKRLLSYLNQLLVASGDSDIIPKELLAEVTEAASQVCESAPQPQQRPRHLSMESEDSADDYPASFQHLNLHENGNNDVKITSVVKNKKVQKPKNVKKQHMPITHNLDYYRLFGEVEVDPPKTYAEVPIARAAVEKVLLFFEEQTLTVDGGSPSTPWSVCGSEFFDSPMLSPNSVSTASLLMSPVPESVDGSSVGDESPSAASRGPSSHRLTDMYASRLSM
uniref:Uncharacterized protein n=1 Tax=Panagrellus redivivus TaxID=6233 RepID=A0A7E4VTX5_PANRE